MAHTRKSCLRRFSWPLWTTDTLCGLVVSQADLVVDPPVSQKVDTAIQGLYDGQHELILPEGFPDPKGAFGADMDLKKVAPGLLHSPTLRLQ